MNKINQLSATQLDALCATIAVTLFSINDVAIKFLSGGYALHQVVLFRSVIGLTIVMTIIAPLSQGWGVIRTQRLGMHLIRSCCVVCANMTFFLGSAAGNLGISLIHQWLSGCGRGSGQPSPTIPSFWRLGWH